MTLAPTPQSPTLCPMSSQNTSGSTLWLAGCSSTSPSPRWAHAHARTRTRTRTQPHKHWYTQRNLNEWKCNESSKKLHCRCSKWHPITGSQTPLLLRKMIAAVLLDCSDALGVKKFTLDDRREIHSIIVTSLYYYFVHNHRILIQWSVWYRTEGDAHILAAYELEFYKMVNLHEVVKPL